MKKELVIVEGTVGEIEGHSVGVGNIWTRDGKLSAKISVWDSKEEVTATCAKGDELKIGSIKIKVKTVKENENGTGSVTLVW